MTTRRLVDRRPVSQTVLSVGMLTLLTATLVALRSSGSARVIALALAGLAHGALLHVARRGWTVPPRVTVAVLAVIVAVGLAGPPQRSRDVWAHATYGQMVVDGHDPYRVRPSDVAANTYIRRMAPGWKDVKAVYGPAFIGLAATGAFIAEQTTSTNHAQAVVARLWFQSLGALALICALTILWRTSADPTALLALGLSPVVTIGIVHEAHNDLLVGLGLLAAVVLARKRPAWAALAAGATVLVKIAALLPLAALMTWVLARHGWRTALRSAIVGVLIIVAGYGAVGGLRAVKPVLAADRLRSHASVWSLDLEVGPFDSGQSSGQNRPAQAVVLLLAGAVVMAHRKDRDGAVIVTGAGLAYLLAAAYVLPWYAGWVLPAAALSWRSWTTRLLLLFASLSLVAYGTGRRATSPTLARAHELLGRPWMAIFELAAIAAMLTASLWRIRWNRRPPLGGSTG